MFTTFSLETKWKYKKLSKLNVFYSWEVYWIKNLRLYSFALKRSDRYVTEKQFFKNLVFDLT